SRTGVHYSAPEGMHDDGVCALALAWYCWGKLGSRRAFEILLSQPATVKHRGALVGGRRNTWSNPLNV
ncbi:MAG TPA: hypothetical protein VE963_00330, partial [Reyranella sp.]|nr:hypothetical protein [Reyranella sp.]